MLVAGVIFFMNSSLVKQNQSYGEKNALKKEGKKTLIH